VTGNAQFYPPTLNPVKVPLVHVKFTDKDGMSQAVLVADERYSHVNRIWSKEDKKIVYVLVKKPVK
jgi:hypothetical protein